MPTHGSMLRILQVWSGMEFERVAHWRRSYGAPPPGANPRPPCTVWTVDIGHRDEFGIDDGHVPAREERLINWNTDEEKERTQPLYLIHDHPDDQGSTPTELRVLTPYSGDPVPNPSGLPLFIESGTNGRIFLYHPGYNMLIAPDKWYSWEQFWRRGGFEGDY